MEDEERQSPWEALIRSRGLLQPKECCLKQHDLLPRTLRSAMEAREAQGQSLRPCRRENQTRMRRWDRSGVADAHDVVAPARRLRGARVPGRHAAAPPKEKANGRSPPGRRTLPLRSHALRP